MSLCYAALKNLVASPVIVELRDQQRLRDQAAGTPKIMQARGMRAVGIAGRPGALFFRFNTLVTGYFRADASVF